MNEKSKLKSKYFGGTHPITPHGRAVGREGEGEKIKGVYSPPLTFHHSLPLFLLVSHFHVYSENTNIYHKDSTNSTYYVQTPALTIDKNSFENNTVSSL